MFSQITLMYVDIINNTKYTLTIPRERGNYLYKLIVSYVLFLCEQCEPNTYLSS